MSSITETELKNIIKSKKLSGIYFIYGQETWMKRYYCKKMISLSSPVMPEFNLQIFEYKDSTLEEISNAIETLPVFAEKKCVAVYDMDIENMPSSDIEKLNSIISDIPDTTILIICLNNIEPNLKKSAKWRSFLKTIDNIGISIDVQKRTSTQLKKMLCSAASKKGCELNPKDAEYIIEMCGSELQILLSELDKLTIYTEKGIITREIIDKLIVKSLTATVYELSRAVIRCNYTESYNILDRLFIAREEPIAILAVLSNAFADLYRAKCAINGAATAESIAQNYDYRGKEFRLRNAARDSAKISMSQLKQCLNILYKSDRDLKGSRVNGRIILEETITSLICIINGVIL